MTYQAALTLRSMNVKTGPIPVSTTTADTCVEDCPFREASCYARGGPMRIFWDAVTRKEKGLPWHLFCQRVANNIPEGALWRHNQAGDLPGDGVIIDNDALMMLVDANQGKRGFTYTHYPMSFNWNATVVEEAVAKGFVINVSANSLEHADELKGLVRAPVVVVLPRDYQVTGGFTPGGHRVVVCPAQYQDYVTCQTCKLCASAKRKSIVGFLAHGAKAREAECIAKGE